MPEMVSENLKSLTDRITKCCEKVGRLAESVRLVAVTKEVSAGEMEEAIAWGVSIVGENRVQDAIAKHRILGDRVEWHLVGHLQTNKVKDAVKIFSLIHSVDSLKLANAVNEEAARIGKHQPILVQVNTSGERSKFGISPTELTGFLKEAVLYPNIGIHGLMTIAPEVEDPEIARPFFRSLKDLLIKTRPIVEGISEGTKYSILSMGMTNDFETAIEEGANMVRIGRAIFG
jgi:pyridoxal phosphate enzyme (YggS family)